MAVDWRQLIREVGTDLRADTDPWRIYPIRHGSDPLREIPSWEDGPRVYAVPEGNSWYYVGQTRQRLRIRLSGHLKDIERATRWAAVITISLNPEISADRLDALEGAARNALRPSMGSRWPGSR
ncbi:hypothetical protein [Micromonospora tulbaghiae]